MSERAWVNGVTLAEPGDPVIQRLSNFGDGVFESMRVDRRGVFLADGHRRRLLAGLERLSLNIDGHALWQQAEALLASVADAAPGLAKLVVSRAPSSLGYRGSGQADQWVLQYSQGLPATDSRPLRLAIPEIRLAHQPALAGIKHCNRLEQVLARQQLDAIGADEGVMLDASGLVIEGCAANLFILEADQLLTPPLEHCGVAGVMREYVLEVVAAECGLRAAEAMIDVPRLLACDGLVLCNSVKGISTVASLRSEEGLHHDLPIPAVLATLRDQVAAQMEAGQ